MMDIEDRYNNPVISLCMDTMDRDKQALVFANTKRSAEKTAEEISKKIKSSRNQDLSDSILKDLSTPTKQCKRLSRCVKKGIAFHHAGLTSKQRGAVEDGFREGKIKIIVSTPTLAAGLDIPAFRTIIKDLRRYGPRGMAYIPVLEYLQMAGRAGRPKYDKYGESICIAGTEAEKDQIMERYIYGEPEDIHSKLAVEPVLRTYLLSLISSGFVKSREDILDFFEDSFWAFQFQDMDRLEIIIEKILNLLIHWEFIRSSSESDFKSADELDEEEYKATLLGRRVAELYLDPLTAHSLIKGVRKGTSMKEIEPFALLQLMSNTLEMRPLLKVRTKDMDDIHEKLVSHEGNMLQNEPSMYEPEYEDYLNSVKTALCIHEWTEEVSEEHLMNKYNIRPGELRAKNETVDWLLYATSELCRIQHFSEIRKEIQKLRLRNKYGVKEELLALLKFKGIGRVYSRRLYSNGIKDVGDVKSTAINTLASIVGKSRAISLKEQVGEDTKGVVVKKHGQITLEDWN